VFFAKFAVAAPICTVIWWLLSPAYLAVVGHTSAAALNGLLGAAIEEVTVTPKGILNTTTELAFVMGGRPYPIQLVALVMGIPTFIALTLASPWPGALRFVTVSLVGCAILALSHVVYVILVFRFAETMQRSIQVPYMIVMLPFLLWILLSYWRHIAAYFDDANARPSAGE